jgi:hypothetical protein
LTVRILSQPALGFAKGHPLEQTLRVAWVAGSIAELAGAAALLVMLAGAFRSAFPLRQSAAIRPVLPLLIAGFTSLLLLLAGSSLATFEAARAGGALLDARHSRELTLVGFYGFLVPISIAMSIRLFPLYFRTQPARILIALTGLGLLLCGLLLRLLDDAGKIRATGGTGRTLILLAVLCFAMSVRIFEPRRQLPRRQVRLWMEPVDLHAISAYGWLIVAAISQIWSDRWLSLEIHLLGTGFVTLLILGTGVQLIPGFARRPMRGKRYIWATLALGNLATICRIAPSIPALHLPVGIERSLGALAGFAGIAALAAFAINLRGALWPPDDEDLRERHQAGNALDPRPGPGKGENSPSL